MKTFLSLIIIFLFVIIKQTNSQEINPLDFFPHHVGDLWQYWTFTQPDNEFHQIEVTAVDTLWTDSSITITEFNGLQEFYFKIFLNDSLKIYRNTLGGWGILYDLKAELNTYWISDPYFPYYTKYVNEYVDKVFVDSLLTREYWTGPDTIFNLPFSTDHLALGIGSFYGEFEAGITVLTGCIVDGVQYGTIVDVAEENEKSQPNNFILNNYPNPFNAETKIEFFLPRTTKTKIVVYDILGNELDVLMDDIMTSGYHTVHFSANHLSSGIYFYSLITENKIETKSMVLLK